MPNNPTNTALLAALAACRDPRQRLLLRNRLVGANLGLVHHVAAGQLGKGSLGHGDLVSVGCIGLIRAIDSFESGRGLQLSSYAVPFIRGAMQHEERDRNQPLKTPRRLRELQQRVCSLQNRRACQGLPPLGQQDLSAALGCSAQQLQEAAAVQQALRLCSLDAPLAAADADGAVASLIERLSHDPVGNADASPALDRHQQQQWLWLQRALAQHDPTDRQLLWGRIVENRDWQALAAEQGQRPRQLQQRYAVLVRALQSGWANAIRPMARRAAMAV